MQIEVEAIELGDKDFFEIRDYVKQRFGISMGDEKRTLIYSRLRPLLRDRGYDGFEDFLEWVRNDKSGEAQTLLASRLTTNHTFFMRESEHFDMLNSLVFPWIEQEFGREKDLRLWCAGCSSGEEAYTLQILAQEYFEHKGGWNLEILATDISEKVLAQSYQGVYSKESLSVVPDSWLKKYFNAYDATNMIVKDSVKKNVTFRRYNLMEEKMPFKKPFQVIFCRNVMIYFDAPTREAMARRFANVLTKGGFLFIGHSESLSNLDVGLGYVRPAVYKR
ncbi:MAG: protein-glutamate O-methyltransferase CheR [Defluviitaleaceae bacterium]|nr:protein-glutamate O-methyltransferase CheR [Defluviitaleaceae bacterium]